MFDQEFQAWAEDESFPCPGTPAIADILQLMGALATYAIDPILTGRTRSWNYRAVHLSSGEWDAATVISRKSGCPICTWNKFSDVEESEGRVQAGSNR